MVESIDSFHYPKGMHGVLQGPLQIAEQFDHSKGNLLAFEELHFRQHVRHQYSSEAAYRRVVLVGLRGFLVLALQEEGRAGGVGLGQQDGTRRNDYEEEPENDEKLAPSLEDGVKELSYIHELPFAAV